MVTMLYFTEFMLFKVINYIDAENLFKINLPKNFQKYLSNRILTPLYSEISLFT